jgi:hypothetical protein
LVQDNIQVGACPKIRDHLTLIYAIQTREPLVASAFYEKKVILTNQLFNLLEEAR